MSRETHPTGAIFSACSAIVLSFALSACTSGPSTTMADPADAPMAQNQPADREVARISQVEPSETAQTAPKRQPNDPIYVNLPSPVLDSKMQQAEKPKGAIGQYIRNEFASDPIIQLVTEPKSKKMGKKTSQAALRAADVEVVSKVSLKEVFGTNSKTGKPSKMVNIVFEATITSQSPPAIYTVSESGHILQNMAVSKRFAKQIREVIVEKIGPDLPAR